MAYPAHPRRSAPATSQTRALRGVSMRRSWIVHRVRLIVRVLVVRLPDAESRDEPTGLRHEHLLDLPRRIERRGAPQIVRHLGVHLVRLADLAPRDALKPEVP